ncbi:MAG: magnesium chelatase, partial [Candidatus Nealsonbacteria bacterium]|nr:magnesium chelatase [Candidatus Nealsonbacteria bacterium]
GPLMDRVDLFITVPSVKYDKLAANNCDAGQNSQAARERVIKTRQIQQNRFNDFSTNAEMGIVMIKKHCLLDGRSQTLLKNYVDSGKLSARGYHRVLKVSRTIADMDGSENILFDHLSEALMYRPKSDTIG